METSKLPTGEPTVEEVRELTKMFPKSYPTIRQKIEESRPKTEQEWREFARWHENFINSMPSVNPKEPVAPANYFKIRMIK
jgi:hypothetical protein